MVNLEVITVIGPDYEIEKLAKSLDEAPGILGFQKVRRELVSANVEKWKRSVMEGDSNETR